MCVVMYIEYFGNWLYVKTWECRGCRAVWCGRSWLLRVVGLGFPILRGTGLFNTRIGLLPEQARASPHPEHAAQLPLDARASHVPVLVAASVVPAVLRPGQLTCTDVHHAAGPDTDRGRRAGGGADAAARRGRAQ